MKAGIVANVVVPHSEYMQFATHFGFKADFCEGAAPESKGVVENRCGYVQRDLLVPGLLEPEWPDLATANAAARAWCAEVNANVHSEIFALPNERLVSERQVLLLCRHDVRRCVLPKHVPSINAAGSRPFVVLAAPRRIWAAMGSAGFPECSIAAHKIHEASAP